MEKVTNKEVMVHVKENSYCKTVWRRKRRWLEHVLKYENFLRDWECKPVSVSLSLENFSQVREEISR